MSAIRPAFPQAVFFCTALGLSACATQHQEQIAAPQPVLEMSADSSRISVDWPGVYKGVLPCADCEGIQTTLSLSQDGSFTLSTQYLGKSQSPTLDRGTFAWDASGGIIALTGKQTTQSYRVGEGRLFHLDQQGERISGALAEKYILNKNFSDKQLENKRWVLTELMGQPVTAAQGQKTAFLFFDVENARAIGNAGCNNFFGSYELLEGNRIRLGLMGSTMMACKDMQTESRLLKILQTADNYVISNDTLSLNKARMAPLARFKLEAEPKQ